MRLVKLATYLLISAQRPAIPLTVAQGLGITAESFSRRIWKSAALTMKRQSLDHRTTTLMDAMLETARQVPDRGVTIYDRRGQNPQTRTYRDFPEMIKSAASRLQTAGVGPGDRVLICLPTCWELIEIWLGAVYRGAHPVLVAPAGALGGAAAHAHKLAGLIEFLTPRRFVCDEATRKQLQDFGAPQAAAISMTPSEFNALQPAAGEVLHKAAPSDIAFMQLTSGSTGRQRAVMIRHSSIIHNSQAMRHFNKIEPYDEGEAVVSWLPLNHDMGLVGCLLFTLVGGYNLWLLRPDSFLARPRLWMQVLSHSKATMSAGPNSSTG